MNQKYFFYPESRFGGYSNIDGTVLFYDRVNSLINKSTILLDVGCGRGEYEEDKIEFKRNLRILKGKVSKVIGIDVDSAGNKNPFLDEFRQIIGVDWPIESNSIDLILCDWVVEHVDDTKKFFSEAKRVLRQSGVILIRTTNNWNYISLFSRLIPKRFHHKVLAVAQPKRKAIDVFPTFYRCNTIPAIKRILRNAGFNKIVVFGHEAEPSYLSFSGFAYGLGVLHQKISPKFFKSTIIGIAKKL